MKNFVFGIAALLCFSVSAHPGRPSPAHHPAPHPVPRPALHPAPASRVRHPAPACHYYDGIPVVLGAVIGAGIVHAVCDSYYVEKVWVPETRVLTGYDVSGNPVYAVTPGHWEYRKVFYR